MLHIIVGLGLLSLGIVGVMNNWYAVVDFVRVLVPAALVLMGTLSVVAGVSARVQERQRQR
jgi:hypothetical protein